MVIVMTEVPLDYVLSGDMKVCEKLFLHFPKNVLLKILKSRKLLLTSCFFGELSARGKDRLGHEFQKASCYS